jgi:hypothetical protein
MPASSAAAISARAIAGFVAKPVSWGMAASARRASFSAQSLGR